MSNHENSDSGQIQFGCANCNSSVTFNPADVSNTTPHNAGGESIECAGCGYAHEPIRYEDDAIEIWDEADLVERWEVQRVYECQFCEAVHSEAEDHEDHVEETHYAELLQESELQNGQNIDAEGGQ